MGKILLYYKYITLENPESEVNAQQELCKKLGLTGRIIIAREGINGTVGGSDDATSTYIQRMREHPLFHDIIFKESEGDADHFPRLRVVLKDEIVHLGINPDDLTPTDGGIHLTPDQVHALLDNKPQNLVILDTRNLYESAIGTFKDAIKAPINNFRELPHYLDQHEELFKDKDVLMFCTGGVRCERASAYLKKKNIVKEVYQIEGGIHCYAEKYPDGYFRGKNYVFDGRIAVKINDDILSTCTLCQKPWDDYSNCINASCNAKILQCPDCIKQTNNTCSKTCAQLVKDKKVVIRTLPAKRSAACLIDSPNTQQHLPHTGSGNP